MLFNSYIFILLFLPLSLLGYFCLNHFQKYTLAKYFLIGMSLWFYSYFHISYLWIILISIGINYACHLLILKQFHPKFTFFCGLTLNIGLLFYFKYFSFLLENINVLFHTGFQIEVLLPLGISFFTFQQLAFLIDTYKGTAGRQSFADYALFITFFPQLIAGPITSHEEMIPQYRDLSVKSFRADNFYLGTRIFIRGLAKKVLLADTFGQAVNWGFQYYTLLDGLNSFLVILLYTLQIYLDFSGYCDMARGIGYMFNIHIPINFFSPYKSRNILEFWDRWHITLTRFFTRYLYIPLGGSRKGTLRTYRNVFLVFLVSGIWHGAGWTFLVWGLLHGTLSVLTRIWHKCKERFGMVLAENSILKKPANFIATVLTLLFVAFAWTFFRADNIAQAGTMIKNVFTFSGNHVFLEIAGFFQLPELWYMMKFLGLHTLPFGYYYCFLLFLALAVFMVFGCKNLYETENKCKPGFADAAFTAFLGVWCTLSLSGVSSFLYFNF